jgi:hypothetical protein
MRDSAWCRIDATLPDMVALVRASTLSWLLVDPLPEAKTGSASFEPRECPWENETVLLNLWGTPNRTPYSATINAIETISARPICAGQSAHHCLGSPRVDSLRADVT